MRTAPHRLAPASILVAAALLSAACDRRASAPLPVPGETTGTAPAAETPVPAADLVPVARRGGFDGLTVTEVVAGETSLELTLNLDARGSLPNGREGFNLCLPAGIDPVLSVEEYQVGEKVVRSASADAASTTTIEDFFGTGLPAKLYSKGFLRHWPLWRLNLERTFWRPAAIERPAGGESRRVRLSIRWDAPATSATQGTGAINGGAMLAVAERLVINPEDLGRWGVARPPLVPEIDAEPVGPAQMAVSATHWARIRIDRDGLYRLNEPALEQAGFPPMQGRMNEVRIFSRGRPAPTQAVELERTIRETSTNVCFYGRASDSPFDPRTVYWVALDNSEPAPTFEPFDESRLEGTARDLTSLMREEVVDRPGAVVARQDQFLNIQSLRWLERELSPGDPLRLEVSLFEPLAGDRQTSVGTEFVFIAAEATHIEDLLTPYHREEPHRWEILIVGPPPAAGDDATTPPEATADGLAIYARQSLTWSRDVTVYADLPIGLFGERPTPLEIRLVDLEPEKKVDEEGSHIWFDLLRVRYRSKVTMREGRIVIDETSAPGSQPAALQLHVVHVRSGEVLGLSVRPDAGDPTRLPIVTRDVRVDNRRGERSEFYHIPDVEIPAVEPMTWPDDVLALDRPTDYLVIVHSSLKETVLPLVEINNGRLLRTRIVEVESLYDYFSGGMLSPEAIRAYLAYWLTRSPSTAPTQVVLIGDASSDFLGITRSDVQNLVPAYRVKRGLESWASDYWATCVAGDDPFGDFQIGRLSVDTAERLRAQLNKIETYETTPIGVWRARLGYIADNLEEFRATSERVRAERMPADYADWRVYLDNIGLEDDWYVPQRIFDRQWQEEKYWRKTSSEATNAIFRHLNAGTALVAFFGHGSPNIWTHERIWLGYDSPNRDSQYLNTAGKYAFILNYTCNTGVFDYPMRPYNICLAEDLMDTPQGGAVAMFVPTGPGTTPLHKLFAAETWRVLFEDGARSFGDITMLGRLRYSLEGNPSDYLYMYALLGDPASRLQLTQRRYGATLTPASIRPGGESVRLTLDNVQPINGEAMIWVRDEEGNTIAEAAGLSYSDRRIEFDVPLPPTLGAPRTLQVSLYGWNVAQKSDFLAGATLRVEQAVPEIVGLGIDEEDGKSIVTVTLRNPAGVDTGAMPLSLLRAEDRQVVAETAIGLQPGETRAYTLEADVARGERPRVLLVRLAVPERLDRTELPLNVERELILPPTAPYIGVVAELSHRRRPNPGVPGVVAATVMRSGGSDVPTWLVYRGADGQVLTSRALNFQAPEGVGNDESLGRADVFVDIASLQPRRSRSASGNDPGEDRLELVRAEGDASTSVTLQTLRVGDLKVREPRLRIVPNSVSHTPESPTDGQTVWIGFVVENRGDFAGIPFRPQIYGEAPRPGLDPLPVRSLDVAGRVGALGPGRRRRVTLRWDPIQNQGRQTVWIDLTSAGTLDEQARLEQQLAYPMYVKSKSAPRIASGPSVTRDEDDRLSNSCHLHIVLANEGETDARAVEVSFFRSPRRRPEDLLGTSLIDLLPARGKREVTYHWQNYDPKSRPSVEVRLKGSQQRIFAVQATDGR